MRVCQFRHDGNYGLVRRSRFGRPAKEELQIYSTEARRGVKRGFNFLRVPERQATESETRDS
jgi:hypothetical protein